MIFQRRRITLIILLLISITLMVSAYKVFRAYTLANKLYAQATTLRSAETRERLASSDTVDSIDYLRQEFHILKEDWDQLQSAIWPFDRLAVLVTWVPQYGENLGVGLQLMESVDAMLSSAEQLDSVFAPALSSLSNVESNVDIAHQFLEQAATSASELELSAEYAQQSAQAFSEIDLEGIVLYSPLRDAYNQIGLVAPLLEIATVGLNASPDLLGFEQPHHVLLLMQNADEIRPTGGFITSVAYVVIEDASLQELTFLISNHTSIDRVDKKNQYEAPPQPFIEYMRLPVWLFRDSNWSPHFPTTAQKAAELYALGRDTPVDTVLAVNQFSVQDALKITGQIALNDGTLVNSNNFIEVAQESWELGYNIDRGRKDIVPDLGNKMINSLNRLASPQEIIRALPIALQMTREKKLLVYSEHDSIQSLAEQVSADGVIPVDQGDYIFVVDTNMSYDKSGINMQKRFDYHVSLQDIAQPYGVLTLDYANLAPAVDDICPGRSNARGTNYELRAVNCFGNYVRVYIPDGSTPKALPYFEIPDEYVWVQNQQPGQFAAIPDEQDKEVLAGLIVLPPGEETQGQLVYALDAQAILAPSSNGALNYSLSAQKQPGVVPHPISITVDLPHNTTIQSISPQPTAVRDDTVYFELLLAEDVVIDIDFQTP